MDQSGNILDGRVKVNSWNEWDPLKHVIVGTATGTMIQAPEPAVLRIGLNTGCLFHNMAPYRRIWLMLQMNNWIILQIC